MGDTPSLLDLIRWSIAKGKKEHRQWLIETMRQMSTAELILIGIYKDRKVWTDDALEAARLIVRERRHDLREMVEAFEIVRNTLGLSTVRADPGTSTRVPGMGARARLWMKRQLVKIKQIKLGPSQRLALTIATGVFLGLLAMRLATGAYHLIFNP